MPFFREGLYVISGEKLKKAIISAANNVANHRFEINEINVFPVPDGDTGANMFVTLSVAGSALEGLEDDSAVSTVIRTAAGAMLRASRGNSGAILCLFFRGLARSLQDKTVATASDMAEALDMAAQLCYDCVRRPAEGTMLTVINSSAKLALRLTEGREMSVSTLWTELMSDARRCLKNSTYRLDVLSEAGVVDAGALGMVCIYEGIESVLCSDEIIERRQGDDNSFGGAYVHMSDTVIDEKGLIAKMGYKLAFDSLADEERLRTELSSLTEGFAAAEYEGRIRCRCFSAEPHKVLEKLLEMGALVYFTAAAHSPCNKISFPEPGKLPDNKAAQGLKNCFCTEFTVLKDASGSSFGEELGEALDSLGDSVVVAESEDIVKCHVHTDAPLEVFSIRPASGFINDIKIENMEFQL